MLKITVFQSIAMSSEGMPSMAILAPWHMLASMSRNAAGFPDISSPTSNPSRMPISVCTSASLVEQASTASVTPTLRASSRR
ncbi:MAG: hypothetical protein A2X52_21925 [Candidatus Rokubacteria bacterium GWC2_70_16]|nr:MAG: hypothetical protein A2X52_21925 [Candidatus Rokubacteria bacterium GWC2_70_16]